ncbi:nuclease [Nocardioides sp. S5]|uniref:thermonuclease family protein n=1 Tax=Nocardioides sp. S5 TaxID=2017486 RepID=UPI001A8D1F86|nr:thermonuclease family protein [Nocardioides sp. S5]QSR30710.1 nuclease [Nocardioides sp. S5]
MRRLALLLLAAALLLALPKVVGTDVLPAQVTDLLGADEARRDRAVVVRVTDGDTLKVRLANGSEKDVRILGIDTPEVYPQLECGGQEATAAMAGLAPVGSKVVLVSDPTQGNRDRYGRLLRYVHRSGDDVGLAQLRSGRAQVFIFRDDPLQRAEDYRAAERRARKDDRGSWAACWR